MSVCWKDTSLCRGDFCEVAEGFPSIQMPAHLSIGVRDETTTMP